MILRRLMQHVEKQNWFAVWLDLGIVILGVTLGFQVTQWNENLAGQRLEAEMVERLETELVTLVVANRTIAAQLADSNSSYDSLIDFLHDPASVTVDSETWRAMILPIMGYPDPVTEFAIYDEFVSTAQLRLLRDTELRAALSQFGQGLSSVETAYGSIALTYGPAFAEIHDQLVLVEEFPEFIAAMTPETRVRLVQRVRMMKTSIQIGRRYAIAIADRADVVRALLPGATLPAAAIPPPHSEAG